jgi:hypothetical protein
MEGMLRFIISYSVHVDHCILRMSFIEGSFRKRHRTDSAEGTMERTRPTRPRAVDIPPPLRAAPASWGMLKAQIQYAWTYNTAVAKVICDSVQSMHSEDLNSRIVTQSKHLTPSLSFSCNQDARHSEGKSGAHVLVDSEIQSSLPASHNHSHL